jgi:hypothetical protein
MTAHPVGFALPHLRDSESAIAKIGATWRQKGKLLAKTGAFGHVPDHQESSGEVGRRHRSNAPPFSLDLPNVHHGTVGDQVSRARIAAHTSNSPRAAHRLSCSGASVVLVRGRQGTLGLLVMRWSVAACSFF